MRTLWISAAVVVLGVAQATDPKTIIGLKAQLGDLVIRKANSVVTAKKNFILGGTNAILSAKQRFFQQQLPNFIEFKTNKINSILQLKKNLLSTTANHVGQIHVSTGGAFNTHPHIRPQIIQTPLQLPNTPVLASPHTSYGVPEISYTPVESAVPSSPHTSYGVPQVPIEPLTTYGFPPLAATSNLRRSIEKTPNSHN